MLQNIWFTPEVHSWARDFNYENYLSLVKRSMPEGYSVLCEEAYNQFKVVISTQFEHDNTKIERPNSEEFLFIHLIPE